MHVYCYLKNRSIPDILQFYMKSWCMLTSQERIPDLINMHAHEIKRPNIASSRRQSYPKLFHVTFPLGLTQCFWLLHPDPLLRFFPHFLGTKDLAVQWNFCQRLWAAYISQLSEDHPFSLTPSAARWLLHGRTGRVTWTSQISWVGPWNVFWCSFPFDGGMFG